VKGGRMTEGFALVAWPDTCGDTGVMTFIVDRDAVLHRHHANPALARNRQIENGARMPMVSGRDWLCHGASSAETVVSSNA
jgi:hypothetical protein